MKNRFAVQGSPEFQIILRNHILNEEISDDGHLSRDGFPVIPSVGDEITMGMSVDPWRVIRRVFKARDGKVVELHVEPCSAMHVSTLRARAAK